MDRDGKVARFNHLCAATALVALVALVFGSLLLRPNLGDFPQYYMGGTMAWLGEWGSLYPMPRPGSLRNPGEPPDSTMRPRYAREAQKRGVGDSFRFIQSPPVAFMLMPLAGLTLKSAQWTWIAVMLACGWWAAVQAGRVYEMLAGHRSKWSGALVLVLALSPTMVRGIRTGNITPLVAACIGAILIDLLRPAGNGVAPGAALVAGALAKYATPPLLIPYFLRGRWKTLLWAAVFGVAVVGTTVAVAGLAPFRIFVTEIAPALGKSAAQTGNQSLQGFLLRLTGAPLPGGVEAAFRAAMLAVFIGIVILAARRRRELDLPEVAAATVAALTAWLIIFGPVCWPHYPIYLFPVYGWLLWNGRTSRTRAILFIIALALAWVPLGGYRWLRLPEPLMSHMLISNLIVLGLGMERLWRGGRQQARRTLHFAYELR